MIESWLSSGVRGVGTRDGDLAQRHILICREVDGRVRDA
eukprot:COSAG03_NODE_12377_length_550_cov_0.731707_2_plen_38_part_01